MEYGRPLRPCFDVTAMRAPADFEKDVMRQRNFLVGAACAAIIAGVAAFVIGLRQPTELRVEMTDDVVELSARR